MPDDVDLVIEARPRDLGGFTVGRVLPAPQRRIVGPWLFFDHLGPVEMPAGHAMTVRPHPHINLATVTYLFEGEIMHHDSLGSMQRIQPGAINWMTAGRGISHSERTPVELVGQARKLHGLQLWCGLPTAREEDPPSFTHYPADALPSVAQVGATIRVLAGTAYGVTSPVVTASRLFYVDVHASAVTTLEAPDYPERAVYVVEGSVAVGGNHYRERHMLVLTPDRAVQLELAAGTRLVMLGGEPLDGSRHIFWNFVSSSQERIEVAKQAWRDRSFPQVPGEDEFIPLPE